MFFTYSCQARPLGCVIRNDLGQREDLWRESSELLDFSAGQALLQFQLLLPGFERFVPWCETFEITKCSSDSCHTPRPPWSSPFWGAWVMGRWDRWPGFWGWRGQGESRRWHPRASSQHLGCTSLCLSVTWVEGCDVRGKVRCAELSIHCYLCYLSILPSKESNSATGYRTIAAQQAGVP